MNQIKENLKIKVKYFILPESLYGLLILILCCFVIAGLSFYFGKKLGGFFGLLTQKMVNQPDEVTKLVLELQNLLKIILFITSFTVGVLKIFNLIYNFFDPQIFYFKKEIQPFIKFKRIYFIFCKIINDDARFECLSTNYKSFEFIIYEHFSNQISLGFVVFKSFLAFFGLFLFVFVVCLIFKQHKAENLKKSLIVMISVDFGIKFPFFFVICYFL